jgi:hypothetical protein
MIVRLIHASLLGVLLLAGPVSAGRGHPIVTARTVTSDIGTPLRGTHWATDITGRVPSVEELNRLREIGGNTLHLYGENFSSGTSVGSKLALIDAIVGMTRDAGFYLVLTIGNGSANGSFDYDYTMDFWNLYARRYANQTHVIYEVQNEPHQWTPGYPGATLAMERDANNLIRSHAPDTPVLLFSYAVFNNSGKVLDDIANLGVAVDWTRTAVAFHGYATPAATKNCLNDVLNAGYPCVCTEFVQNPEKILHLAEASDFEDQGVSWLNFIRLDRLTWDNFNAPAETGGVVWAPDMGTWPVPAHPRHNLGGEPVAPFMGDLFSSGGSVVATSAAVDVSAPLAAPELIYQNARAGEFTMVEPDLLSHREYQVRLHFAEIQHGSVGQRRFDLDLNGNPVLSDFDIVGEAGAANRSVVREFVARAGASGEIALALRNGSEGEPLVSAVEFLPLRYVRQPIAGDCEIRAHVAQLEATHGWSKAGVMIRENSTPGSRHVMLANRGGEQRQFQWSGGT